MYVPVSWDQGEHDVPDDFRSPRGAAPVYRVIQAEPGDTLADITRKAYGHNSTGNQLKILAANDNLNGAINVPI